MFSSCFAEARTRTLRATSGRVSRIRACSRASRLSPWRSSVSRGACAPAPCSAAADDGVAPCAPSGRNGLAGRECRQSGHAEIDANHVVRRLPRAAGSGVSIISETNQRPASQETVARFSGPGEAHLLAHAHPANDRQLDALAVGAEGAGLIGGQKLGRSVFFLNRGYLPRFSKKLRKDGAEIDDGLLHGALGNVEHPRELRALDARSAGGAAIPRTACRRPCTASATRPAPSCRRSVRCRRHGRNTSALGHVRIERDLMGEEHVACVRQDRRLFRSNSPRSCELLRLILWPRAAIEYLPIDRR